MDDLPTTPRSRPPRIVIADDHPVYLGGLRALLGTTDMEVVGEAANGFEALEVVKRTRPDLALLDIRMPGLSGLETLRRIKDQAPRVSVILVTAFQSERYLVDAVLGGASGFVLKSDPPEELIRTVRETLSGHHAPCGAWWEDLLQRFRTGPESREPKKAPEILSEKELEVLQYLVHGFSDGEIARMGRMSGGTVRAHCSHAFKKLDVSDRTQAVLLGLREGWLHLEEEP